jgi:hypothetical protein
MKRVTLEEAARRLGISKDAAYKRAQRGTLAKKRGADGRLYIYLDEKRSENTSTGAIQPGGTNKGNVASLTTLANVSAVLAAIGLGIYVLGMLSLLMPIRRFFYARLGCCVVRSGRSPQDGSCWAGCRLVGQVSVLLSARDYHLRECGLGRVEVRVLVQALGGARLVRQEVREMAPN